MPILSTVCSLSRAGIFVLLVDHKIERLEFGEYVVTGFGGRVDPIEAFNKALHGSMLDAVGELLRNLTVYGMEQSSENECVLNFGTRTFQLTL
jgi:hypothetical protein